MQKLFVVSEPQIRHRIIKAAVDTIIPQYTKFYEKCVASDLMHQEIDWTSAHLSD